MSTNFCGNCGSRVDDGERFCTVCGAPVENAAAQPAQPIQPTQPVQPIQPPVQPMPQYTYTQPVNAMPENKEGGGLAITAFVLSFIIPPVALILGIIGLVKYKRSYRGFCIAAVVISAVFTLFGILLAAILVPAMIGYINASRRASYANSSRTAASCYPVMTEAENVNYIDNDNDNDNDIDIDVNGIRFTFTSSVK